MAGTQIFPQAVPFGVDVEKLYEEIKASVEGIVDVHDVRAWSLDGTSHGLSSHIVVAENTSVAQMAAIKKSVINIVAKLGVGEFYTTLEF